MFALVFVIFIFVVLYIIVYGTKNFDYWKKRGVKYEKPIPFFGNNARVMFAQLAWTASVDEMYWKYPNEKVVGFFKGTRPQLVIRDPEIIRQILVTDFNNFYKRGLMRGTIIEPLFRNLFFAEGDTWRLLRQRMTPAFTSGKLKAMFPLIVERAEKLQHRVVAAATADSELDARDLMARYTTDIIGACGFGLDSDSLSDENSAFRQLGSKIFKPNFTKIVKALLKEIFPQFFGHLTFLEDIENDMLTLIDEIQRRRNYEPSQRNDFIDLMLQYKKQSKIIGSSIEKFDTDGKPETVELEFDEILIAAQIFIFFAAGFETSSFATSVTLHQLAYNPTVQQKVQDEIDNVLLRHNNKLSYDALKEMTYLNWTFKEGLRMMPSPGFLIRESVGPYTFKDLNLSIGKDVIIMIPITALQNDPEYFTKPDQFMPERFDPEKFPQNNYVYMPFGIGPRACIGERLGLMQSLAGLAAILSVCSVEPGPTTVRHPEIDPRSRVVQNVKKGFPLIFRKRQM